jgi:hypothetical protein
LSDDTDGPAPATVPVSLLADLQAGLLDDDTAALVRRRIRDDPANAERMEALDRVRRELAEFGSDLASAPEVPGGVTARVGTALRAAPPANHVVGSSGPAAAHAVRDSPGRIRFAAAVVGLIAALAAAGMGAATILRMPERTHDPGPTADRITVSSRADGLPLTDPQLLDLLRQPPDLGPLADPQRRASCLSGLGYPTSTTVLAAEPLTVTGRPGVLMLLPGDAPRTIHAVVVALNCSSADTGLLADRAVTRP